jgi:hypothetical protein
MALRQDSPVRPEISRRGIFLRTAKSRTTLKSPTSFPTTPPGNFRQRQGRTGVNSQRQSRPLPGQISVTIDSLKNQLCYQRKIAPTRG